MVASVKQPESNDLTPATVASILRKSRNSVIDLIKTGQLEAQDVRNPGSKRPTYRIHPDAVEKWRESRRVQPTMQAMDEHRPQTQINPVFARMRAAKRKAGK